MPAKDKTKAKFKTEELSASDETSESGKVSAEKPEVEAEDSPTVITVKSAKKSSTLEPEFPSKPEEKPETEDMSVPETQAKEDEKPLSYEVEEKRKEEDKKESDGDKPITPDFSKEEPKKVASFSLLDADVEKTENKPSFKPDTSEPPKTEPQKDEVGQEEVNDWIDVASEKKDGGGKKFSAKPFIFTLIFVVIAGIIGGGIYYYTTQVQKGSSSQQAEPTTTPQVTETPQATATPTAEEKLDLTKYKVSVLNGSGIPGEANVVKGLLTKAGFKNIDGGNAASYDYKDTEVSLKGNLPSGVYGAVETALSSTYTVSKSDTSLKDSSTYDVVIIVGVKK